MQPEATPAVSAPAPTVTVTEAAPTATPTEAEAKAFIYMKESGNNPAAVNSSGCRGLGQACPGSKLPCTDYDYQCQDNFFTSYMQNRYGSWQAAKSHWLARVSINGRDMGNWW